MTKTFQIATVLASAALFAGCGGGQTVHTKQGAVAGSALGAIAGGVIGHQSGRGLEGAAVGAAGGALAGGVYGSAQDEKAGQR